MMNRQEINKQANKWLSIDTKNRASLVVMVEQNDDEEPHISLLGGGNCEFLINALCYMITRYTTFAYAIENAMERYKGFKASHN